MSTTPTASASASAKFDPEKFDPEKIRSHPYYLGQPIIPNDIAWATIDDGLFVVGVERSESVKTETLRESVEDTSTQTTAKASQPVCFTMVARLPFEGFFMDADGGWKGPMLYTKEFVDLKLTARAVTPPPGHPYAAEFSNVLQNLDALTDQVATSSRKTGLFNPQENPVRSVKLRHVLFEAKKADSPDRPDHPNAFPTKDWPVRSSQAKEDLAKIVNENTHQVYRLPVYDTNRLLVDPKHYRLKLVGAVVLVAFTLQRWANDVFGADIQYMHILAPPPSGGSPSSKRVHPPQNDPGSPSKRP
ncbi:hypothetical protein FB45DRAFT_1009366, partial [Roridomyces roridus]